MIQLLVGLKGSGKTKTLMDEVNKAVEVSRGNVICIEYGKKLTFNVYSSVRLIDVQEYGLKDGKELYGFVCGMLSANYDITEIFIDSALKMCNDDMADFESFFLRLNKKISELGIHCLITASAAPEEFPETIKTLIREGE
jgi:hypothetical protein